MAAMKKKWDERAESWIRWSRTPDHDHYYWRFARPALLALLPEPGTLTLDIGCGEGRLARELTELGHRAVGVEASPMLAAAAREATPPTEVVIADAASMPLPDAEADLAIACMSLMNFDDLGAVLSEIGRVLTPNGCFCFVTVHPLRSIRSARSALGEVRYFDELRYAVIDERAGLRMEFHDSHRPLSALHSGIEDAGLVLETLREPVPDDSYVADHPEVQKCRDDPFLLLGRAVKP